MGRPKIELGFDVLQVAVDRAKRPTATRPSQSHRVVGRETRSDRDGLVILSQVKKSRSSPWHLCDLPSMRGTSAKKVPFRPCFAGASAQPKKGRKSITFEGGNAAVTTYLVTLRDRETQTVVGYYNGAWTTDQRRALTIRRRDAAEAHAARMRDRCPRNAELIIVEETSADD